MLRQINFSYGTDSVDNKYNQPLPEETRLIDLLIKKSGLLNENSTVRAATDLAKQTVELQFHHKYANKDAFVNAMKDFLNNASKTELNLTYEMKETMRGLGLKPVLRMNRDKLEELIKDLELREPAPVSNLLEGEREVERIYCFGMG